MYILAIESTCDETAAALISQRREIVASAVASQQAIHDRFDGVVPELAARAHLERIVPIVRSVLTTAQIRPQEDLAAIAVATEPGLPGSLLVGLAAAKALCVAWNKPLVAINHVQAHIYACQIGRAESIFPCLGFVVSGGHTNLYVCKSACNWRYLGGTIDDAAGEAFDKVAVMLGLPFPGGPNLSQLAQQGNPKSFHFPRPLLNQRDTLNFSFSGLKTAVRYQLFGTGKQDFQAFNIPDSTKADVAASFQLAVIDCIVGKAELALRQTGLKRLCVGGGVCANVLLRSELGAMCRKNSCELILAAPDLCTDNAAMGAIAWERFLAGDFADLDIDIQPGLLRGD